MGRKSLGTTTPSSPRKEIAGRNNRGQAALCPQNSPAYLFVNLIDVLKQTHSRSRARIFSIPLFFVVVVVVFFFQIESF